MASSIITGCNPDVWTKVATNIKKGRIENVDCPGTVKYYAAVPTGDPAPVLGEQTGRLVSAAVVDGVDGLDLYYYPVGMSCQVRTITIL